MLLRAEVVAYCVAAGELLLGNLNQSAGNVAADGAGIPGSHVAIVAVLRDLDAQFLSNLIFQLLQCLTCLLNYQSVAAFIIVCHLNHQPFLEE